ncbi:MAG TPA: translocation/assembly module TamB domain-containing protein [Bacteroidales bacterium]|nr:translocation/assembly module TamB domain-containing protein [Bacteroidales bacterium]HSA43331.1 translocation/assembly module TamB domain-containing protein [Bacteroidales bacterium]
MAKVKVNTIFRKRAVRILIKTLAILILVPVILYGVLRTSRVQTFLAGKLTDWLSRELRAEVRAGGVDVSWFLDIVVEDLYLSDQQHDTLCYIRKTIIDIRELRYKKHQLAIKTLTLNRPVINLSRSAAHESMNFQFLADYFRSGDTSAAQGPNWHITIEGLQLNEAAFRYNDDRFPAAGKGIDYHHIYINPLDVRISHIRTAGDTLFARLDQLRIKEQSGFLLRKCHADIMVTDSLVDLKNLQLRTDYTHLETDLAFSYKSAQDFNDFVNRVGINAAFLPSDLDMRDLVYFAPSLAGLENRLMLEGSVEGRINNLKIKDLVINYGTFSKFSGDIRLSGLPVIEETFIQVSVKNLYTNHYDLSTIRAGSKTLTVPDEISKLGNIRIKGNFTGFISDFVSYAYFKTDIGSVSTDISLKTAGSDQIAYSGNIKTRDFNLGILAGQQHWFGNLNLKADITGTGLSPDNMTFNIDGTIDSLYFLNNRFNEIRLAGGFFKQRFSGNLQVIDPRLNLDFDGYADISGSKPLFNFIANIKQANLNRLNLVKSDSAMVFSTEIKANLTDYQPDSLTGMIELTNTVLHVNRSVYQMKNCRLTADRLENGNRNLNLESDFIDGSLSGSFSFNTLGTSVQDYFYRWFPALQSQPLAVSDDIQPQFVFGLTLKNTQYLSRIFYPKLSLADNTSFEGTFNPGASICLLKVKGSRLDWLSNRFDAPEIDISAVDRELQLSAKASRIAISDQLGIENFSFETRGTSDSLYFSTGWFNRQAMLTNTGDLDGYLHVLGPGRFHLHLDHSNTIINDSLWIIPGDNLIQVDSQRITISNLVFLSGDEKVSLDGLISPDPLDFLKIRFEGFDLSNFDFLTLAQGFDFNGNIIGTVELKNLYERPDMLSDILVNNLIVNGDKLGTAQIKTHWDPAVKALQANAEIIYKGNIGESRPVSINGYYYPQLKDNNLDFQIDIDNFKLRTIAHFLRSFSSRFNGLASGTLNLRGSLREPALSGKVQVRRGELKIDYLNTAYSFNHMFEIGKDYISFDGIEAMDSLGNTAIITGGIRHENFRNFHLDIRVKPDKLLVLNTAAGEDQLFYGKAFASGEVQIKGPPEQLSFSIQAKTDKGTQFFMPINTTADLGNNEFVVFKSELQDTVVLPPGPASARSGIHLDFNLDATPEAQVRIFMPGEMGNIKATGDGKLRMEVTPAGDFTIFGDYRIQQGQFLFTLQNVVNRLFEIEQGGLIQFTGNPYSTQLNIRAVHKLDVPLSGLRLTQDQLNSLNRKIPVHCIIDLQGSLFNPDLSFKLETPEKDPEINRILFSQLDTNNQQQMSEQMIFLLVLKQFKPVEKSNPLDLNASVGSSSWDILSSQLNNWLSQISSDFDIGINYKPGDKNLTNDQLTVALSTQLFDERVSIDGNFGYAASERSPGSTGQNASNIVGDVKVEVRLTRDGRFRVKAYNKSNNISLFENNAPYTQGVGVFFRKDFDDLQDLFSGRKKSVIQH